ncbi:MAG: response regulator, partial [Bacteroidota bacterium]
MENNTIINGLIIDDEPHCQDHLKTLIQENCPEIQVIGVLSSVREAESFIRKRLPDLIFLDVMMPGRNGFSLIDSIGRTNCPIIFTTAH